MEYQEAIDYLYSRLPVFHRIGPKAFKPGLQNTERLCEALGNPHLKFKSIHVAGTNGKGSTSHMLASIYQAAGFRVGLYTSPHLKSFTERIRINGQPIPEQEVAGFVDTHKGLIDAISPSFFEVTVAMAFGYFAAQRVDLAIIEVGLGGRLDSTNIISPQLSLITNIGFDHTDILGETLDKIAFEKAGIIKETIPVIAGELLPETEPVFERMAAEKNAPLYRAVDYYKARVDGHRNGLLDVTVQASVSGKEYGFALDLAGDYQALNLPAVLLATDLLQEQFPVGEGVIRDALRSVVSGTGLKGRFQIIQESPKIIVDTAHNKPGLRAFFKALESVPKQQLHIVFGMVADKDPGLLLSELPVAARYYFCEAESPRSLKSIDLQKEASRFGLLGVPFTDVNSALDEAKKNTNVNDVIITVGSNYIVSELNCL
ncbi:bifunctional folylpolyglutamate synthase/dihydrofolate synthase [Arsenicibacter rosenii]|uniref:Dihydrofolate synthase/folylpolyglutamate synthase n=1 Tax=Arsenicibacter rosenii TaxID=1750698 RepID=A0A1S2VRI9_9BACT|nr:folylpolyglutamate synthase/dihydrofolate synthase family protein [Arsenicibacter rosenii]OIN60925.1 dihydrofolate synthase [Arsenicibacter rosenii]